MKRIFFLALISVTCENLYLVQGADPTYSPTFFPTLPVGEFKDFGLGWEPSMVIDDTTGMNLMFGGNGYDYGGNGKWLKCTHFDSRTCTNIHRQDVKYWTDSTLATRHASLRPANCNYPRVAQIPNGGDVLISCSGDDVIVRCPSDVDGANFEGDNCYVYMDSSTTGLSSWNEMQYITIDKYENLILADVNQRKVFLCDLGVTPTCSEILDLTSTGLSSITTCKTNKVFFNDDSSKAFISCGGSGVLEGTVSDHAAGSLTVIEKILFLNNVLFSSLSIFVNSCIYFKM